MTHYDYTEEQLRKQLKQRYNRRFYIIAHVGVLAMVYVASLILPALNIVATITFLALIPHLLWFAYQEYHRWIDHKVERELYEQDAPNYADTSKRKRYAHHEPEVRYEITDDGELSPVTHNMPDSDKQKRKVKSYYEEDYQPRYEKKSRYDDERKGSKKSKKRRKFDTDELDLKKVIKKIIDIVD